MRRAAERIKKAAVVPYAARCALCAVRSCPSATRSRNAPASRSSDTAVGPPMLPEVAKTAVASARWADRREGRRVASAWRPATAIETVVPRPSACRTARARSASVESVGSMLIRAERKVVPARSERASASHHSATAPGEMVARAVRLRTQRARRVVADVTNSGVRAGAIGRSPRRGGIPVRVAAEPKIARHNSAAKTAVRAGVPNGVLIA